MVFFRLIKKHVLTTTAAIVHKQVRNIPTNTIKNIAPALSSFPVLVAVGVGPVADEHTLSIVIQYCTFTYLQIVHYIVLVHVPLW